MPGYDARMTDFVMVVPTRGRPHTVAELAKAFTSSCTGQTRLLIAVDDDDPEMSAYCEAVTEAKKVFPDTGIVVQAAPGCMAVALNMAVGHVLAGGEQPKAIGFMGDDHRPRTLGWDTSYLEALDSRPGVVYGNDLIHGENLPTQFAVSRSVAQALGFLSPPGLKHLYIDNYWLDIGRESGCLTYLPDVTVEHMHPVADKGEYDEGYQRVNAPEMYAHDEAAYTAHMQEFRSRDVALIQGAAGH